MTVNNQVVITRV